MASNVQTFKLTPAQARAIVSPTKKMHHMTRKALTRLGLINQNGGLTQTGIGVRAQLPRMAEGTTNGAYTVQIENRDRLADALTTEERDRVVSAIKEVARDQRRSYPEVTDLEAIENAQGVLTLPGEGCQGGYPIEDDGTETFEAYRLVLTYPKAVLQIAKELAA